MILFPLFIILSAWKFPFFYDDAFISFRIAENLIATGQPFYNVDEAVFTSTSLLFPLWNAFLNLILGKNWITHIHLVNAILLCCLFLWLFLRMRSRIDSKTNAWMALGLMAVLLCPSHFTVVNTGMECIFFQVTLFFTLLQPKMARWSWVALLVRPEGFLAGLAVFLAEAFSRSLSFAFRRHLVPALISGLVYAGIAWFWYGSLVPESIWAKSHYDTDRLQQVLLGFQYLVLPGYGLFSFLIGATWFQFPECRSEFRPLLIWLLLHTLFFSLVAAWWAWYVPPLFIVMATLVGRSLKFWSESGKANQTKWASMVPVVGLILIGWQAWKSGTIMASNAKAFSIRKDASEKISHYLSHHIPDNQSVLVEPIGLLGYFARNTRFLDYPGLTRPEMGHFLASLSWKIPIQMVDSKTDSAVLAHFQPDWMLLFPYEKKVFQSVQSFQLNYALADSLLYYPHHEDFKLIYLARRN